MDLTGVGGFVWLRDAADSLQSLCLPAAHKQQEYKRKKKPSPIDEKPIGDQTNSLTKDTSQGSLLGYSYTTQQPNQYNKEY